MSAFDNLRLAQQTIDNLQGLRADMRANASAHQAMAAASNPDVTTLATYQNDCAAQYLRRIGWVEAVLADAAQRAQLLDGLSRVGSVETDATSLIDMMKPVAQALADADKSSYAAITTAAQAVLDGVTAPANLWPE